MSILTVGTTVAAATPQEMAVHKLIGTTPRYGRAVVLSPVDLPLDFIETAREMGMPIKGFSAYLIEPRDADGGPVTDETGPVGMSAEELSDLAYVAILSEADPLAYHPQIGPLPTVTLLQRVSKSTTLATIDRRISELADKFREELEEELFRFAQAADDLLDPEFPDGTDSDGTDSDGTDSDGTN